MAPKVARRAGIAPFYVMEVMKAAAVHARTGADVVHLEVGQPSTPAPRPVLDAAARHLRDSPLHYTDALGTDELRHAIARWYAERHAHAVGADRIAVTGGASGACILAFAASFDAGDRVAVTRPSYPCYRHMLDVLAVDVVDIPVDAGTRFQPTPELVERAIAQHGPLAGLVVASPSNPTGTMLRDDELAALAATCRQHDMRLVSDEIYHGITYGQPAPTAAHHDPHAIVINSFSKYFSMTGWRLGWLLLPDELVEPVERLAQNLTVAPPTLPQLAAVEAFTPAAVDELESHVTRYAANRRILLDGLAAAGFTQVAPSDGAFYLWVDLRGHPRLDAYDEADGPEADEPDSEAVARDWLEGLAIAVTPGIDFDPVAGRSFVRLSFAGSTEAIRQAADRLVRWAQM